MKRTQIAPFAMLAAGLLMAASANALMPPSGGGGPDDSPDNPDPGSPGGYQAVADEYIYNGVTPANSAYTDSAHFRIYHNGSRVASVSQRNLDITLAHLEGAYELFIDDMGFRSTGLSYHDYSDAGPWYKLNIYPASYMNAGGVMLYDYNSGLTYLEILASQLTSPRVTVHEFGHSLTLASQTWVDQTRTGAWWEAVANWVADTYINSEHYQKVRQQYGLGEPYTIINLDKVISNSHMMLVSDQNHYEAWPFLTFLTNNPADLSGLGEDTVHRMLSGHLRNNETPLHVLERVAAPDRVQAILGSYWAHMAYMDIGHPRARQAFLQNRQRLNFSNLDPMGNQTYRVKPARQPAYGGANIHPLRVTGDGTIGIHVANLGNGLPESNFTATLAIRAGEEVRYVAMPDGYGEAVIRSGEEVSLVVANTPDTLYQYDAFNSSSSSREMRGLNYEVSFEGAAPAHQ